MIALVSGIAIVSAPKTQGCTAPIHFTMECLCNAVNTHASVASKEMTYAHALGFDDPISFVRLTPA
jgi:hypothetical protein